MNETQPPSPRYAADAIADVLEDMNVAYANKRKDLVGVQEINPQALMRLLMLDVLFIRLTHLEEDVNRCETAGTMLARFSELSDQASALMDDIKSI